MWKKNVFLFLSMTLASVLLCQNCATIISRSEQTIPVTSTPVGARVFVNGIEQGATPLNVMLARKQKGQVIRIDSPGYNPVEIRPKRIMKAGPILGNFLIGVILGYVPAGFNALFGLMKLDDPDNVGKTSLLIWGGTSAVVCGILTAIDAGGKGKGYALSPKELNVTLTKADGTPRVDTLLIDADELQNIKWIRVCRD